MQERKCFICRGFGNIIHNFRNKREIEENRRVETGGQEYQPSSNRFEVLKIDISNKGKKKKGKLLREVTVKIGLKQKDNEDGITVKALFDSAVTGLMISSEFARMNKFKKKKLERLIYIRNVNGTFNHERPNEHIVEVELFYRGHKERLEIDVIGGQKRSVILEMPWLVYNNPEIDWKIGEIKMRRCLGECEKQQKMKQTKPRWQKQDEKTRKKKEVQKTNS